MDLLNEILQHPIDPDYAVVAARPAPRRATGHRSGRHPSLRLGLTAVALVCGAMFAVSAVQDARSAPAQQTERAELVRQIGEQQQRQQALRDEVGAATTQVAELRARVLGDDTRGAALQRRLAETELAAGATGVTGPGVVVTAHDGPDGQNQDSGRIVDLDLQQLVNGLWASGAEAVAVNGYRLTATTAIRGAGDAVTVDYRSLSAPYQVEAIGDPAALQSGFAASAGGQWWNYLRRTYGVSFDVTTSRDLQLAADPGHVTRYARARR